MLWGSLLAAGLLLLYGRFDWDQDTAVHEGAFRGFVTSAYFFVFTLPTFYYTARKLLANRKTVFVLTSIYALLCVMPYHWLGIDRLPVFSNDFRWQYFSHPGLSAPSLDWFPQALGHSSIPHEGWFFGSLLAAGVICFPIIRRP